MDLISTSFLGGFMASFIAGIFTGLGGFCIFLKKKYSKDNINIMLNIAAGVMLSASVFSLLVPAMNEIMVSNINIYFRALHYCGAVFFGVAFVLKDSTFWTSTSS